MAFEFVAGLLIMLVVLSLVPARIRGRTRAVSARAWDPLCAFLRGQLLVALVDAVTIGILGALLAVPVAAMTVVSSVGFVVYLKFGNSEDRFGGGVIAVVMLDGVRLFVANILLVTGYETVLELEDERQGD